MFRKIITLVLISMFFSFTLADVKKKTSSTINFKGLGKLQLNNSMLLKNNSKLSIDNNDFKSEGFAGKMVGMFFPKGKKGEIQDLNIKKIYNLDYEKSEYTEHDIKPVLLDNSPMNTETSEEVEVSEKEEKFGEIEIIRNEFTVKKTDKSEKIAGFSSNLYIVTWIYEAVNKTKGTHGGDSLIVNIWATKNSTKLETAQKEENNFSKEYMKLIGIEFDESTKDMLGLNWVQLLAKIKPSEGTSSQPEINNETMNKLSKIEGYPVKYNGNFYVKDYNKKIGEKTSAKNEDVDLGSAGKALGGFFKKKMKKKKSKKEETISGGYEKLFNYSYEILEVSVDKIKKGKVTLPANFKKIEKENNPGFDFKSFK